MCRRTWLIVVIGALSVVACNGDDEKTEARRTTTTAEVVETTTTAVPETTTTSEAPLSEVDELRRRAAELFLRASELYFAPDPARVAEVYDTQCPCFAAFQAQLADIHARGLTAQNQPVTILGIRYEANSSPDFPAFTMVFQSDEQVLVDASGAVIERRPGAEPTGLGLSMLTRDGRSLIADYIQLNLGPEALQEVIAEGVP